MSTTIHAIVLPRIPTKSSPFPFSSCSDAQTAQEKNAKYMKFDDELTSQDTRKERKEREEIMRVKRRPFFQSYPSGNGASLAGTSHVESKEHHADASLSCFDESKTFVLEFCYLSLFILLQSRLAHFGFQGNQEIASHFKTQPTGCHTGSNLEEIGNDTLVKTANAFLANDYAHGVEHAFVLVPHARHGVDLKSSAKDVTGRKLAQRGGWKARSGVKKTSTTYKG